MAIDRKQEILQTLAQMLESPTQEKITTASLAAKCAVSEAALYRHFANKAKMFEHLIAFIENSLFTIINKITSDETDGIAQIRAILTMMLKFAEKNPGMTRVLTGDALVNEDVALQHRVTQLLDRLESSIKQSLKIAEAQGRGNGNPEAQANLMLCYVVGRWHQYAKSGFKRKPLAFAEVQIAALTMLTNVD